MAMMALAIGDDRISTLLRREAIIHGLSDLPSMSFEVHSSFDQEIRFEK